MTERLDQIEAILASVAQQQQQAQADWAETQQQIQAELAASRRQAQAELAEIRQIVDSTARSVAANSELVAANARDSTELRQHLDSVARTAEANATATAETRMMVAAGFEATRQTFAETREGIDDVVRMVTTASAEAQADRQRNDQERQRNDQAHQAFTESFQSLLAEIARIWQRLSA